MFNNQPYKMAINQSPNEGFSIVFAPLAWAFQPATIHLFKVGI